MARSRHTGVTRHKKGMKRIGVGGIINGTGLPPVSKKTARETLSEIPWELRPKAEKLASRIEVLEAEADEKRREIAALEKFEFWENRTKTALNTVTRSMKTADAEKHAALESFLAEIESVAKLTVASYFEIQLKEKGSDHREKNRSIRLLGEYRSTFGKGMSEMEIEFALKAYSMVEETLMKSEEVPELLAMKQGLPLDDITPETVGTLLLDRVVVGITEQSILLDDAVEQTKAIIGNSGLTRQQQIEAVKHVERRMLVEHGQSFEMGISGDLYLDDRRVMALAVKLWEVSFKVTEDLDLAYSAVKAEMKLEEGAVHTDAQLTSIYASGMFLARWAHVAFPRVMTSHTYAAALMCTSVTDEVLEDLVIQWPAFEINVPDGILVHDGDDYNRIRVMVDETSACFWVYAKKHGDRKLLFAPYGEQKPSLADILTEPSGPSELDRVVFMARRLTAGLLLAMQHTNNFKERTIAGKRAIGDKRQPPDHRVVFVGSPIKIDARPAVQKFLASNLRRGKPAPPSVQMLVRGHYKRQVMGVGRLGRKVIWVHPYWKGPEDAPILSRPKKLGGPR